MGLSLNTNLAPSYIRQLNDIYILWFKNSNNYIIFNEGNMNLMHFYFKSSSKTHFKQLINTLGAYSVDESESIFNDFTQLLNECDLKLPENGSKIHNLDESQIWETVNYKIDNKLIQINYSSEKVKLLIHPQFAHHECALEKKTHTFFHINLKNDFLYLYRNNIHCGAYQKKDYHLLQGKFAMELLCVLTNTSENNWLGTFHASTISNTKEAIMLVGDSGKGKSTLSAILMANGYNLLADDFTPVLAKNQTIFSYPAAISIKEGAFTVLDPLFKNLKQSITYSINKSKGVIRYIAPESIDNLEKNLSCTKIVHVNYKKDSNTVLKIVSAETILKILIPDSWLSPNEVNANHFLNWLEKVTFYELIYSDTKEVLAKFDELFNN